MDPRQVTVESGLISEQLLEESLPFFCVALLLAFIVVPSVTFSIARRWGMQQPQVAGAALTAATLVSALAILSASALLLAAIGWLPPPDRW